MTGTEHTITQVEPLPRPAGHCAVYVDGELALKAHREIVAALGLWAGRVMRPEELQRALATAREEEALRRALRMLAACDRTEEELRRQLERQEFPQPTIATVLDRLRDKGLIDDRHYAEEYVRTQSTRRGLGPAALRAKLVQLGVASALVDEALAEEMSPETQRAIAESAARKRLRRLRAVPDQARKSRLYSFMLRRGFDYDTAEEVSEKLLGDE